MATKINWTGETWNPVTGCSKISAGCVNCYAHDIALRLKMQGQQRYKNGFDVTLHEDVLSEPTHWRNPRTIFVCSMSDLFHLSVPFEFIDKVMGVIRSTPRHTYQLLTKRAERMAEYFSTRPIPQNVWLGVTVEASNVKHRMEYLQKLNAPIRFLSCEPLVDDLGVMNLDGIDWVIVGGENAYRARPMKEEWVISIKEQCDNQGALFFFKQWGTYGGDGIKRTAEVNGNELRGKVYEAMPDVSMSRPKQLSLFG